MNRRQRLAILGAFVVTGIVILVTGCDLFSSKLPVARIAASILSGETPLLVRFSADDSFDPDGTIIGYAWTFGDGAQATGPEVDHVYAPAAPQTFTVTLTVTDDDGKSSTAQQSIEVHASSTAGNNPPSARFTFEPTHGNSPLAVSFDADLTRDVDGEVEVYGWDFGDGSTGSGIRIDHTYSALATTNFAVTLTVTDDDGASTSITGIVSVTVPEDIPFDGPTAAFEAGAPTKIYDAGEGLPSVPSLFEVDFDPQGASAAPGHEIEHYIWNFGDGESATLAGPAVVTHVFRSGSPSHTFVVSLTVIDDQGLQDSAVISVTVRND